MRKLSNFHIVIAGCYFKSKSDFINVMFVNSKFKQLSSFYHYNPIRIDSTTVNLFPNIQTQHHYASNDLILNAQKHICNFEMNDEQYKEILTREGEWVCKKIKIDKVYTISKLPPEITIIDGLINLDSNQTFFDITNVTEIRELFSFPMPIQYVSLSTRLLSIPMKCFKNCLFLKEIDLKNVNSIGNECFYMCSSLTSITMSPYLNYFGENCFYMCNSLVNITTNKKLMVETKMDYQIAKVFQKNGISVSQTVIQKEDIQELQEEIPENCCEIGDQCFEGSTKIEFNLQNIKKIGSYCFNKCEQLTSITITNNLSSIGEWCFDDCPQLKQIKLIENNEFSCEVPFFIKRMIEKSGGVCKVPNTFRKEDQKYFKGIIPEGIEVIGKRVFMRDYNLTNIVIPNTVTKINTMAFQQLHCLTELSLSSQLKCLPTFFMRDCPNVQRIDLSHVETIVSGCFDKCKSLRTIVLSSVIKNISFDAFKKCKCLTDIEVTDLKTISTPIKWELAELLKRKGVNCEICVLTKDDIVEVGDIYEIEEGIKEIKPFCFIGITMGTVIIPKTLLLIEKNAFYCCEINNFIVADETNITFENGCFNGSSIKNRDYPKQLFEGGDEVHFIERFNDKWC